jgi:L-2-hydroxyglutarate oxidase LhgO
LERVTAAEAREIEPRVRTHDRALFSPSTATVDPAQVVEAFVEEAKNAGVEVRSGVAYLGLESGVVSTSEGRIETGYLINAGGLYADRLARSFGFAERYRILPFKGMYLQADPSAPPLRTNVYPVPDLAMPFLGVHFTVKVDGGVTVGPTAIPAFWREQYRGFKRFNLGEFIQIARLEGRMFAGNRAKFRSIAMRELPKYYKRYLVRRAEALVDGVWPSHFRRWGPAGIRAQLVDVERYVLVTDFVVEGDDRSFHVLNAVSPAFTCAMPFAEYVLDEIGERAN